MHYNIPAVQYFLRGPSITLTGNLSRVKNETVSAVGRVGADLTQLEISGLPKIPETVWVPLMKKLPCLKALNLRWVSRSFCFKTVAYIYRT
jgi:hypothetical protein